MTGVGKTALLRLFCDDRAGELAACQIGPNAMNTHV
jgi:hypothetical protein